MLRLVAILGIFATGQAWGLSCVKPDAAAAFQQASDADQRYVVLYGSFNFDPVEADGKAEFSYASEFSGQFLTKDGFSGDITLPVTVSLECAGPWCAKIYPETRYIAFVEQSENALKFLVGPCYGLAFQKPTNNDIERVEACAAGGACAPKN